MKFTTDSHFLIGHAHFNAGKPCQDYALSGIHQDAAYAVVADGCSTGGLTDVGSRILALATVRALRSWTDFPNSFGPGEVSMARRDGVSQARFTLGLDRSDMLATCIYAYFTPKGGFIHLEGDGVIAIMYRNGEIKMSRYDWMDNTPYYPAYLGNLDGFIQAHKGDLQAKRLTKENWIVSNGTFEDIGGQEFTLSEGLQGITEEISSDTCAEIEYVAIFTDGITQIAELEWKEAVVEALAFKSTEGEFAKRRLNRMLKDVHKKGHGPIDDISFAVIKFNHQNEDVQP